MNQVKQFKKHCENYLLQTIKRLYFGQEFDPNSKYKARKLQLGHWFTLSFALLLGYTMFFYM